VAVVTLNLVLGIIASLLKIAEKSMESMTPEQLAPFLERHEKRMEFWEGLAKKFRGGDA
jgi:hypothetical protein